MSNIENKKNTYTDQFGGKLPAGVKPKKYTAYRATAKKINIENKTDAPKDNSKGTESVQINPETPKKIMAKKRKIENKKKTY